MILIISFLSLFNVSKLFLLMFPYSHKFFLYLRFQFSNDLIHEYNVVIINTYFILIKFELYKLTQMKFDKIV